MMTDLKPFKLDIDELISEFAQAGSTEFAELKAIWRSRKFSFIFEASPSTNQACFTQSLFAHAIGYMVSGNSLSHRLGGLYCLYCLFETQPFKPPFKIYLCLRELKELRNIIVCAKEKDIKVVSALVKHMLQRNMFLFGFVDITDGSATERVNEVSDIQNARVQVAYKKLFANTRIEDFIHMDLGMELDVDLLKRKSSEYAAAKELIIKEAGEVIDVHSIEHNMENKQLIGDVVEKTAEDWNNEKGLFYQQTGMGPLSITSNQLARLTGSTEKSHLLGSVPPGEQETNRHSIRQRCDDNFAGNELDNFIPEQDFGKIKEQDDGHDDENFGNELEAELLCLPEFEDEGKDDK
ncbi:uncharacterized protein [Coffea arabica]|uniref:Uncharacterized protein isoform X1 n=2 Tax=Coffea arabica TaxID=13443 RepID=A0A6P6SMY4_COFAR|nr:uncharacterized protein LOC113692854 isoform X1 [Coffea arabica]